MSGSWIERAHRELLDRRVPGGAWAYRDGGSPAVEPTAMAGFGLMAARLASTDPGPDRPSAAVGRAGAWLAGVQCEDGSIPSVPGSPTPGWATPYALLLWGRLGGFEAHRRRAREWLVSVSGRPVHPSSADRSVLGHDPGLIGWPWVVGTHSWLEPTAMAILALAREGWRAHPRVRRGTNLIVDRTIPGGGWNYGNKIVFGQALRPQPGPTGVALVALAELAPPDCPAVGPAIEYLRRVLPSTRAAASLGWGVLGLKAHGACPPEAGNWLEAAYERIAGKPDAVVGLGLLLLASSSLLSP